MVVYGQVAIGPPGSGKSTFCWGMQQYLGSWGRKPRVVNLDPANDRTPYDCAIDVRDLVDAGVIMDELGLGPNGALVYCMEYIEAHVEWLEEKLEALGDGVYVLFDCPGQVELFTHHTSLKGVLQRLAKRFDYRLAAVHLVDAMHCSSPPTYISASLLSLTTMLRLELPHINILSKADLLKNVDPKDIAFGLHYYAEAKVRDVAMLIGLDAQRGDGDGGGDGDGDGGGDGDGDGAPSEAARRVLLQGAKFRALNEAVSEAIDDFGLLHFHFLGISDAESMGRVMVAIDKANGYQMLAAESENRDEYLAMIQGHGPAGSLQHLLGDVEEHFASSETG